VRLRVRRRGSKPLVTRTVRGRAGGNRITWNGKRRRGRAVRPGRYQLTLTATAPDGTTETVTVRATIVARR
jgi:hypothetical protein